MTLVFKIQTPFCFHSAKNQLKPTNISKKYEMSAPFKYISKCWKVLLDWETFLGGGGSDDSWVENFSALFGINLFSRKTIFVMMLDFLIKNFYYHGANLFDFPNQMLPKNTILFLLSSVSCSCSQPQKIMNKIHLLTHVLWGSV